MNASDVLVERLIAWGVDTIFGLPGDGINGVMEAFAKPRRRFASSMCVTKSRRRSWLAPMPSSPDVSAFASLPPARVASICSMASTTPRWTRSRARHHRHAVQRCDWRPFSSRMSNSTSSSSMSPLQQPRDERGAHGARGRSRDPSAIEKRGVAHITIPIDMQQQPAKAEKSQRTSLTTLPQSRHHRERAANRGSSGRREGLSTTVSESPFLPARAPSAPQRAIAAGRSSRCADRQGRYSERLRAR